MQRLSSIICSLSACILLSIPSCYANATTWQEHIDSANRAYMARDYSEATTQCLRAIKEAEQFGTNDSRLAKSLNYLAKTYSHGGENRLKVEALCKRSVAITEQSLGRNHPDLLIPLHLLTETYVLEDKIELADSTLERAWKIDEALVNSIAPDAAAQKRIAARDLNLIGIFYDARNLSSKAEQIYSLAIRLRPKSSVLFSNRAMARKKLFNKKGVEEDFATAKRLSFPN